ncbi:saccharopine dehydrogenase NADP-binding domain-containing protein [Aestuariicella sp. G3-2]|uniref:saccharopine dehydrogenase family protein n=1 Tax=Pseudomaricurvus albidus TaxID=2842452 RepID=UPI001C0C36E7|nr:saccharopine dehydrogenase NADP-binding domain-containing protein [Aestuariicella albida]MBU3070766.1 saccharopine dehydrogenase NADP-binding domain-containing protein [Aestuariicella albida]
MSKNREYGIVVYGATGYTGRLVCEYLNNQYGVNGDVKWAMAGRSQDKLEAVRDEMGIPADVPLVVADSGSSDSIRKLVESTQVLLTTVGPYQLYGSDVVKACAEAGTDYVDLCGEPAWMHEMIAAHGATAKASGARIVFSCGFDSVPFDLGVYFLQQAAKEKLGSPVSRVKGRVRAMKGTFSGGTLASFKATVAAAAKDPKLGQVLMNPFALTEGFTGPEQPPGLQPIYDEDLGSWSAPFVMATINTKNIHRSNFLLGHDYGNDFVYDEMMLTGPGEQGETIANAVAKDTSMADNDLKPGEGPSKEERETGFYDVLFAGTTAQGDSIRASVKGDKDPGYGSTSKMIAESAVCLLKNPEAASGGIWTPASAMGSLLIDRLQNNAGLTFQVES